MHEFYRVNYRGLKADALKVLEPQLIKACITEAYNPAHVLKGQLKEIARTDPKTGQRSNEFIGHLINAGTPLQSEEFMGRWTKAAEKARLGRRHDGHRIQFYNHQPKLGSRRIECQFLVACVDCEFPYFVQYAEAKEHVPLIIVMDHSGDHVEYVVPNADQVYGDHSHSFMRTVGKL